ncbi:MAG: diguanylate cyclase, partial [Chromatiales bacterium]|nr:diguanylate cyclase [Chromatiales bacterium]
MGNSSRLNHRYRGYLSKPILYPLIAVFFIFGGSFIVLFSWHLSNSIDSEISHQMVELEGIYRADVEDDARHMIVETHGFKNIPGLKEALKNRDQEQLLALSASFYQRLSHHLHITHLYFTGPDRINLLRVHEPSRYGDRIDRYTTLKAEESKKVSYGLELGALGTFTLRVVMPWYEGDTLIGFIEIGEEIDHITQKIRNLLDVDAKVFINKKVLNREEWQSGMAMLGRDYNWDRFPNHIYVSHEQKEEPYFFDEITKHLFASTPLIEKHVIDISTPPKHIKAAFMPLYDVQDRRVGELLISVDVTRWLNNVYFSILLSIGIAVLANILLISLFIRIARRTEDELNDAHQMLTNEADVRTRLQTMHIEELEAKNRTLELTQNRLGEREGQLSRAQHMAHMGSWEWDFENDIVSCSDETRTILGLSCNFDTCQIEDINLHVHKDDRENIRRALTKAINDGKPFDQEYRIVRPDGSIRLIHGQAELASNHSSDGTTRLFGTMHDLTEQKHSEEINRHLGNILDNASNEIILFSADSKIILQANHTAQQHLNYSETELYSQTLFDILKFDEKHFDQSVAPLDNRNSHEIHIEAELQPKDAAPYPVELRIQKSHYHSEPVYIALALDISEKQAQQQELVHQGLHDPLTKLPNRLQLTKQTLGAIKSAQITESSVVLVLININRFQEINDTLGHNNGDQILLQYAKRVQTIM